LLDGIVVCACGRENLTEDGEVLGDCWACLRSVEAPVRLRFGPRVLVLNAGTRVTRHHLQRDYAYDQVVGEVVSHPTRPDLWGLRNATGAVWRATGPDGEVKDVPPGRSLGLVLRTTIDFGRVTGTLD
jgi:hypothetical protein